MFNDIKEAFTTRLRWRDKFIIGLAGLCTLAAVVGVIAGEDEKQDTYSSRAKTVTTQSKPKATGVPAGAKGYEIVEQEDFPAHDKHSLTVRLPVRVDSEEQLAAIGEYMRETYGNGRKRVFINYYLTGASVGEVASYGYTHYRPEGPDVSLIGQTKDDYEKTEAASTGRYDDVEVIGTWEDPTPFAGKIVVYRENGKIYSDSYYNSPEPSKVALEEVTRSGKTAYLIKTGHNEWFQIDDDGNLGIYSSDGRLIRTATKANF